jgi:membrane protein YqaA with SNARE-associated domain
MKKKSWDRLHQFADRWWYAPLIGFVVAIDYYLFVIPNDALVLAAAAFDPKKWLSIGLCAGFGSSLGALSVAYLLDRYGIGLLLSHFPDLPHTHVWIFSVHFIDQYGSLAIWLIALGPFLQHPMIALAVADHMPLSKLLLFIVAGRVPKYIFYAYAAGRMPKLLQYLHRKKEE